MIAHGSHFLRVILSVLLRCERQGELKLGFAAARADGDLAAVQVDDVLHNIQAETRAGLIHRARTVGLVEAVEHMRQILRRNADAGVADSEYAQLSLLMDLQPQRTAVLDELYRVIGQVVP